MAESTVSMAAGNRGRPIRCNTEQNWLRECGIICHRPSHGTTLTQCHLVTCQQWARNNCGRNWRKVVAQGYTRIYIAIYVTGTIVLFSIIVSERAVLWCGRQITIMS